MPLNLGENREQTSVEKAMSDYIAMHIKTALEQRTDNKIPISAVRVSFPAHLVLEAVAEALAEKNIKVFKDKCGFGQPLAYFI